MRSLCALGALLLTTALTLAPGCRRNRGLDPRPEAASATAAQAASPRLGPCDPSSPTQTLTLVHVNDLHASYHPDRDGQSPWARLRGYFDQVRAETPHALFTDGGDAYEKGSVAELLSRGAATRDALFAMRFDVRVLGNHDFAWGPDEVTRFAADPHARVLASNVHRHKAPFAARDYVDLTVGCLRVGFFGLLTRPVGDQDKPIDADYLPGFRTDHDVIGRARQLVGAHRSSVQLLVLLSHLGEEEDEKLAAEVDGIDVILGAHSHSKLDAPKKINDRTLIVQAGTGAKHVARLDLRYHLADKRIDDVRYKLVDNEPDKLPVDRVVQTAVDRALAAHAPHASRPLGYLENELSGSAAARLSALAAMATLGAEAALVDDESPQKSLPKGPISQQSLVDTFPVQRQPPDTPGFTSFYLVTVPGSTLDQLRRREGKDLDFVGPDRIDPRRPYRLALPKSVALHPERAGKGITFDGAQPGGEIWEALDAFARLRTSACRFVDSDKPLDGCTP